MRTKRQYVSKTGRAYGQAVRNTNSGTRSGTLNGYPQETVSASQGRHDERVFGGIVVERNLTALELDEELDEGWKAFYQTYRTRPSRRAF